MAELNLYGIAIAQIDAKIADLNRAKDIINEAAMSRPKVDAPVERKKRGPNKRKGLPTSGWAPTASEAEKA